MSDRLQTSEAYLEVQSMVVVELQYREEYELSQSHLPTYTVLSYTAIQDTNLKQTIFTLFSEFNVFN